MMEVDRDEDKQKEEKVPSAPKEVIDAFDTAYTNGWGFQCSGVLPKGSLVVAFIHNPHSASGEGVPEEKLTQVLQQAFATSLIKVDDYLGRTYLQVFWTLYQQIPAILQKIVDLGYSLNLQHKLDVYFAPHSRIDFTRLENMFIARFMDLTRQFYQRPGFNDRDPWITAFGCCSSNKWALFCTWNWQTPEGREFCQELRRRMPDRIDQEADEKCNYYQWNRWNATAKKYQLFQYASWWYSNVRPASPSIEIDVHDAPDALDALQAMQQQQKQKQEVQEDPPKAAEPEKDMCVVCLAAVPNTVVRPCGHCVVCRACSDKLQKDPVNASICVMCRAPISSILWDGGERVLDVVE